MGDIDYDRTLAQLFGVIQHMHSKQIIHRDIKLENFVFKTTEYNVLKIIDFEYATQLEELTDHEELMGSHKCMSPGLLRSGSKKGEEWTPDARGYIYTKADDVWAA